MIAPPERPPACNAPEPPRAGQFTHYCVADLDHSGRHFCLLGHGWANEADEEE